MTASRSRRRSIIRALMMVAFLVLVVHPIGSCAREETSEADLQKQKQMQAATAARRKQRRDARIVKKVLQAASSEKHYAVLGLHNWEIQIPPKQLIITKKYKLTIPGFRLFHISTDRIKRAYRTRAVVVHPDKNRDPQANEAFVALEKSLSVLTNPQRRQEYDKALLLLNQKKQQEVIHHVLETFQVVLGTLQKALSTVKSLLGPFAFPVLILCALII